MKQVLYVVEDETAVQFRYRVRNVIKALEKSKGWQGKYVVKSQVSDLDLTGIVLLMIERQTAKDNIILRLIQKAHNLGIKVLFDLDDLVFDYNDLRLVANTVGEKNLFYWLGYFWGIRRIAKRVDGFICTNDFLARKLKRSFNKPVRVICNSLNCEQVEVSEKWVTKLKKSDMAKKPVRGREFVIGYFSGSPTHKKDFQLVESELVRFLGAYEDAVLKVVGEMEFSGGMKKWVGKGRVEILNKVDYLKLQELIAKVDVSIAPLLVNDFTNCKSELKFFEAAVVETTTIASPTYSFKHAITDGENGFLAQPGEWYDKLEYLYKNPEGNRKMALVAKKYALKHYYGEEFLKEVEEAYDYFAK